MKEEKINQLLRGVDEIFREYADGMKGKERYSVEYLKIAIKSTIQQHLKEKGSIKAVEGGDKK